MANITFYVNVILNIFRIPVFIIVVEMYHGTIIASSFFDSFNLDWTAECDVLAYFFNMAGWYPPEVNRFQRKKNVEFMKR